MGDTLRIGTRRSALALWQAEHVRMLLMESWPHLNVELVPFTTRGDRELGKALPEIGGKGLFTAELEAALREGRIDLAVHSLKDLPTEMPDGLTLAAIPKRADPHDVLISRHGLPLSELPLEPIIGTSSNRRAAQVLLARPDARIQPLRGNVDTRVRKALNPNGPYDAVLLALAGLKRLGLEGKATEVLPFDVMLPAPGQGALGIQCRARDERVLGLLRPLDDAETRAAVVAERAFLEGLGGGCAMPVAALGRVQGRKVFLQGLYVTADGIPVRVEGEEELELAQVLGLRLASDALARARRLHRAVPRRGTPLRVLVTRAPEQAEALVRGLRALGMEPVLYPTIRVAPPEDTGSLDRALLDLFAGKYQWLILTSVNGVRFLWQRLEALGHTRLPSTLNVGVIGPATARALRERGVEPDVVPDEYVAERLADALGEVQGHSILLARADRARAALRRILQARGARVHEVVAYRTVIAPPTTPPPDADIVTFTSPSTVEGFVRALGERTLASHVRVVCIGPITAKAAQKWGIPVHAVAEEYTIPGLIQAVRHIAKTDARIF